MFRDPNMGTIIGQPTACVNLARVQAIAGKTGRLAISLLWGHIWVVLGYVRFRSCASCDFPEGRDIFLGANMKDHGI